MQRNEIRFLLNGVLQHAATVSPSDTLLDYLRLEKRLTGTKEGCAEGDCGACTVLVGQLGASGLQYQAVNACIRLMPSLDGCHVVTVEHLARGGQLHPVQQAMVEHHGSQCGFCTPGIVMALYALWMENPSPTETQIEVALQGNLCRCTGYQPIINAALAVASYGSPAADILVAEREKVISALAALQDHQRVVVSGEGGTAILPADVDDLADVLLAHPKATIVAGATDVGLWVTKFLRPISPAVFLGHIDGLKAITQTDTALTLGAGVSYTQAQPALVAAYPHLGPFWDRIAGWQVRNMGTVGGNIANGSPIGDTPPVLIALGAVLILRKGRDEREVPLEDFFIDYGKQDRTEGEFVLGVRIPVTAGGLHAAYKISKRRDEDISSVCAAFNVTVTEGRITAARIAFGGMAATPKRAASAEAALVGAPFTGESFAAAALALPQDFTPLSDWRATADYRMLVAQNLFRRFYLENSETAQPVRLQGAGA